MIHGFVLEKESGTSVADEVNCVCICKSLFSDICVIKGTERERKRGKLLKRRGGEGVALVGWAELRGPICLRSPGQFERPSYSQTGFKAVNEAHDSNMT
jgi:hypothetical protein